jgi:hypothetical protein
MAVPCLTILGPPSFSNCFQWSLITALPVPQSFSDLVVPEVKVISHGCRYGLLFIMRLDDDLYLDAEVVEGHIVFDDYHCWNGSAGGPITYISKGKAIIILQDDSLWLFLGPLRSVHAITIDPSIDKKATTIRSHHQMHGRRHYCRPSPRLGGGCKLLAAEKG